LKGRQSLEAYPKLVAKAYFAKHCGTGVDCCETVK